MNIGYETLRKKMNFIFKKHGAKTAVVSLKSNGRKIRICYSELLGIIKRVAELLSTAKLNRSDRIAVISPHTPQALVLDFALAYTGYTAVLIDSSLPKEEINRLIEYSDVSAIFTTDKLYSSLSSNFTGKIPTFEIGDNFSYRLFDSSVREIRKNTVVPTNSDVIAIIFSSGTTGSMKGVEITYSSILQAHKYMVVYTGISTKTTFLDVLPHNHIVGYSAAMSNFLTGGEFGLLSEVNAQSLAQGFMDYQPNSFMMIPKIFEVIKDKIIAGIEQKSAFAKCYAYTAMKLSGAVRKATGLKLRFLTKPIRSAAVGRNLTICGCGTAPCTEELVKFYLDLGIEFLNGYGTTETGFPITTMNHNEKYTTKGAGKVDQFPEIQVKIHDPDANGVGEIYVKTPLIMNGYFREPELTAAAFDKNGFFKTGDSGFIDNNGNLHITGRIKEAILLHNGKKVSPFDIDTYYSKLCGDVKIASCGVTGADGFDSIHIFIEKQGQSIEIINRTRNIILKHSSKVASSYRISEIHEIDTIPLTSVGKVKRFLLKEIAMKSSDKNAPKHITAKYEENVFDIVCGCIREITANLPELTLDSKLKTDLGMDSLNTFELCVALDEKFGVSVESHLNDNITIGDIVAIIKKNSTSLQNKNNDAASYPLPKTEKDHRRFNRFVKLSDKLWNIKINGKHNIDPHERYIICPNHESHLDGLFVIGHCDDEIKRNICSVAADYLFEDKIYRQGLIMLGGIPVHRSGNTTTAMKRALECISSGSYNLLIHPEGTRTRTGILGEFKPGAATLSIESGLKILPVCINGAYKIFPPDRTLPKAFDLKHFRKYPLEIEFGTPIDPKGKTAKEITSEMRKQIVAMKKF